MCLQLMNRIKQPLADVAARAVFFPRATRAPCSKNKVLVKVLKEIFQRGGSYVRISNITKYGRKRDWLMGKLRFQTLREKVAEEIRLKILNQELTPGMRIIEQELSDELGVSRGPIREALRQLEQEGMIEYTRNIGCSVREVTRQDVYETYLLRSSYEILAVRLFDAQFTDEEIARMEEAVELMKSLTIENYSNVVAYGCMLHAVIIEKAGLARLTKAWCDLEYGEIFSCNAGYTDKMSVIKRQYPIHKELVEVIKTRDVEKICKAISEHYMLTVKRLETDRKGVQAEKQDGQ